MMKRILFFSALMLNFGIALCEKPQFTKEELMKKPLSELNQMFWGHEEVQKMYKANYHLLLAYDNALAAHMACKDRKNMQACKAIPDLMNHLAGWQAVVQHAQKQVTQHPLLDLLTECIDEKKAMGNAKKQELTTPEEVYDCL